MLKLLEKALIILSSLNTEKIEDGEEVAVEEVEDEQSKMEGMESIALLLDGSISGHFVQLPESVYYQMGQSRLFVSTSYLSVKQPTTPTPPFANPKPCWALDCNMPAKARRIRQHQENLRRAQSNVTPPQSTTSSVREESENQLMQPSNPEPLESSVVAVPATSSLCNLERFLETVTPSVPVQHFSKQRTMRGWRTSDVEYQPYFVLGDLWESFKEWSAYGVGVPLILNEANCVIQYYVPYLSGIQIYVDHLKSSINSRQLTEDIDDNSFTDSSSDGSSDYEQEKGSLHYLREKSNNHHPKNDILHRMDHFSMNDENNVVQEDFSSDDSDSATTQSCLIFDSVFLLQQILDLAQRFPEMKSLRSCDLLPSSWLSVAWYPIYRIPIGPTLKDLDACFLTFHSLHTPTTGNNLIERTYESDINGTKFNTRIHTIRC
uniref:Uncharacterized protein n=1 Tax=Lactuca sativa TaxID=4236 RepID=A0A9R1VTG7_LACSA|nr:hypothetical protein LSAT_V11C400223950 [Lactuca sativa]